MTNAAPYVQSLCDIGQGNTDITRVGDNVEFAGFDMNWEASVGDTYNVMRMLVIQWRMDDAIDAPTVAKVFDSVSSGSVYSPQYQFLYSDREKYHVLYDKKILLTSTYAFTSAGGIPVSPSFASYTNAIKTGKVHIKPSKKMRAKIQYNPNATTGAYKLYLLVLSDSTVSPNPNFNFAGQIYYRDA